MEKYQVFARKYRPKTFKEVLGQKAVVTTLKNAIVMNRVAHAYLFCGARGTGKTTLARLFAKALNCPHLSSDTEPCNTCSSCRDIGLSQSLDVLEIDGASHRGIEDIRQINETIGFMPAYSRYKIYLIDEVHMLTKEAFNALLKSLEEPPSHVKFFFATTEPHKILPTILSRCHRFNLRRIPEEEMTKKLKQIGTEMGMAIEEEVFPLIADFSEGSLRDAESLFDQILSFQKDKITLEMVEEFLGIPSKELLFALDEAGKEGRMIAAFEITETLLSSGKNTAYFLEELLFHFRSLFLLKMGQSLSSSFKARYEKSQTYYSKEQLLEIFDLLQEAQVEKRHSLSERVSLEMLLLKILRTHTKISIDTLVNRLESLEKRLSSEKEISREEEKIVERKEEKQEKAQTPLSLQEQSRFDTLMHFTAKELNGSLKKEI